MPLIQGSGLLSGRIWQELVWLALGQVISMIGVVVAVRVLTSFLSPEVYGEFALGTTVATLTSQVALGPLSNAAERFFILSQESGELSEFVAATRSLTTRVSAIILIVGVTLCAAIGIFDVHWLPLGVTALSFAVLSGWDKVLSGIQNAGRQRAIVAWHQALREWLKPLFALGGLIAFNSSATVLLAYSIAAAGVLISQLVFLRRFITPKAALGARAVTAQMIGNRMWRYALPFSAYGIFTWLQISSDRWALQWFMDTDAVGLYAAVSQIGAYPFTVLTGVLMQLIAPVLFTQAGDGRDHARVQSAMRTLALLCGGMLALTAVGSIISLAGHQFIFDLLVGREFGQVSYLLPLAVLASGVFNTGQIASLGPLIVGDSGSLLVPTIGAAALSVLMNIVGARLFGIQGVMVALLLFSICYAAGVALVGLSRLRGLQINRSRT